MVGFLKRVRLRKRITTLHWLNHLLNKRRKESVSNIQTPFLLLENTFSIKLLRVDYDKEILRVLTEAGEKGLSVSKISRHVYNSYNSFFTVVTYDDVHRYVSQYLLRNSKNPESIIEKNERGIYHLNFKSQVTLQLMLQFTDNVIESEQESKNEDCSLSLF